MVCSKCGKSVDGNAVFCSYCGNKLRPPMPEVPKTDEFLVCPECNTEFALGQVYCDKCGTKLVSPRRVEAKEPKNDFLTRLKTDYRPYVLRGIAIALAVLFLVLWTSGVIDW